jgi:hypothetical protein
VGLSQGLTVWLLFKMLAPSKLSELGNRQNNNNNNNNNISKQRRAEEITK